MPRSSATGARWVCDRLQALFSNGSLKPALASQILDLQQNQLIAGDALGCAGSYTSEREAPSCPGFANQHRLPITQPG
ncbi:MAG: hypothetical protein U1F63_10050 [Chitinivorax sp.]